MAGRLILVVVAVAGLWLAPLLIRHVFPGLPSYLEGRPDLFYGLSQPANGGAPVLRDQNAPGDLMATCPQSAEGWVPDGGRVAAVQFEQLGSERVLLSVQMDDLGGDGYAFEYICWQGGFIPLFSWEEVLGFGLPVYGLWSKLLVWLALLGLVWLLLFLGKRLFGRAG